MDEATLISRFRALRVWHSGAWRTIAPRALPAGAVVPLSAGRAAPDQILILESLAASVEAAGALILGESPDAVAASARGMGVPPMRMAETAMPRDLTILTSGTEGQPKPVIVPWKTILSSAPTASQSDDVWLLLYSLTRFAGLAVLAHCLVNRQALVIPTDPADQQQTITEAISADANCISATPSWMRRLLVAADAELLSRWHPRQITLGGEAAPQSLLDQITQRWPDARLTHIYAATEAGTCFSVSDRREGIPLAKLAHGRAGAAGRLQDGELIIERDGRTIRTGDLFEQVGNRILFRGRKSEIINVGGVKVSPQRVESILANFPAVRELRVYARRSPLTGECVAADVVSDSPTIRDDLLAFAQDNLPKHEWPMVIRQVERIELSPAGKTLRRKA